MEIEYRRASVRPSARRPRGLAASKIKDILCWPRRQAQNCRYMQVGQIRGLAVFNILARFDAESSIQAARVCWDFFWIQAICFSSFASWSSYAKSRLVKMVRLGKSGGLRRIPESHFLARGLQGQKIFPIQVRICWLLRKKEKMPVQPRNSFFRVKG